MILYLGVVSLKLRPRYKNFMQYIDTLVPLNLFFQFTPFKDRTEAEKALGKIPEFNPYKPIKFWVDPAAEAFPAKKFTYGPALAKFESGALAYNEDTKTFETEVFTISGRDAATVNIPPDNFNFSDPKWADHIWTYYEVPLTINLEKYEVVSAPGIGLTPIARNKELHEQFLSKTTGGNVSADFEKKVLDLLNQILAKV